MTQLTKWLELYRCVVLTVIAVALLAIYFRTPVPFTLDNLRNKKVQAIEIPLVRVQGGYIDADVSGAVEISN